MYDQIPTKSLCDFFNRVYLPSDISAQWLGICMYRDDSMVEYTPGQPGIFGMRPATTSSGSCYYFNNNNINFPEVHYVCFYLLCFLCRVETSKIIWMKTMLLKKLRKNWNMELSMSSSCSSLFHFACWLWFTPSTQSNIIQSRTCTCKLIHQFRVSKVNLKIEKTCKGFLNQSYPMWWTEYGYVCIYV